MQIKKLVVKSFLKIRRIVIFPKKSLELFSNGMLGTLPFPEPRFSKAKGVSKSTKIPATVAQFLLKKTNSFCNSSTIECLFNFDFAI